MHGQEKQTVLFCCIGKRLQHGSTSTMLWRPSLANKTVRQSDCLICAWEKLQRPRPTDFLCAKCKRRHCCMPPICKPNLRCLSCRSCSPGANLDSRQVTFQSFRPWMCRRRLPHCRSAEHMQLSVAQDRRGRSARNHRYSSGPKRSSVGQKCQSKCRDHLKHQLIAQLHHLNT